MKRFISIFLMVVLIFCTFVGCGASDEDMILSRIDEFITAIEKGDTKSYIKCMDPDLQTLIKSGTDTIGSVFGISNAYDVTSTLSTFFNSSLLESTKTSIHFEKKDIKSSKISEDNATFYIVYDVIVESEYYEKPIENECVIGFKLVKKEGKWYIKDISEASAEADTEILTDGLNIISGTEFSDGVAFIMYNDENGNYNTVAVDKKGKILFEPDDDFDIDDSVFFKNGIMVIENFVYDKSGKIIASPEMSDYDELITGNCNGYVLAKKCVESFEGNQYYVGVINNKGEWEHELSADNPIVKCYENKVADGKAKSSSFDVYVSEKISDTVLEIKIGYSTMYYNFLTNEISSGYVHYESVNYQNQQCGIYKYDLDGNRSLILKNFDGSAFYDNVFIGSEMVFDEYGDWDDSELSTKIFDYSGNVITDLTKYKDIEFIESSNSDLFVNDHILIIITNDSGVEYLCLINKTGEMAFDPIKIDSKDEIENFDKNGFTISNFAERKYVSYDFEGNKTEYTDIAEFYGFNDGLALVKNTAGQYYYINFKGEKVIK